VLILWSAAPVGALGNLVIKPASIAISSFFSGSDMTIYGDLPAGCQAVLIIRGKRIDEEMMRKSRHWDLWLNSGEVDIDNAPLLYIAFSSDPALLNNSGESPWGYTALEKTVTFTGRIKPVEDDAIFSEFIQLKERDKLYHLYPGGLMITSLESGRELAQANVHLPSRLKPGRYEVALWVLQKDTILEKRIATFDVMLTGLPKLLQGMAKKHGVAYGVFAVAVAMTAGMLTGIVFRRKGGAGTSKQNPSPS
jgi:hypothetical protein